VENSKNMSENKMTNTAGANNSILIQPPGQLPIYQADTIPRSMGNMAYQVVYPEIFYRLQPYIIMVCDQIDTYGSIMPTQEMVEQITDSIYDDVNRMYPDMSEYAGAYDKNPDNDPPAMDNSSPAAFNRGFGMFGRRFRRRGALRDLIDILLISEFFRRRRRFY